MDNADVADRIANQKIPIPTHELFDHSFTCSVRREIGVGGVMTGP